ncbi:sigma-70 family RNA polymerase sigma factor, partial [Ruminococcus sp. AF25-17]
MLEQASVEKMFQKYGEMLYKICIVMLENTYDAEDTVQDVLIKYMTKSLFLKLMNM